MSDERVSLVALIITLGALGAGCGSAPRATPAATPTLDTLARCLDARGASTSLAVFDPTWDESPWNLRTLQVTWPAIGATSPTLVVWRGANAADGARILRSLADRYGVPGLRRSGQLVARWDGAPAAAANADLRACLP